MSTELEIIAKSIELAKLPEDVFGEISGTDVYSKLEVLTKRYRPLVKKVFPEVYIGNPAAYSIAQVTFGKLSLLKAGADKKIRLGTYGDRSASAPGVTVDNPSVLVKGKYTRYASFMAGDISDLHAAFYEDGGKRTEVLLKATRETNDNQLLENERDILEAIQVKLAGTDWAGCIPTVIDSFLIDDGTSGKRPRVNVVQRFTGFYSAVQIHQALPLGVDAKTITWMWKRLIILMDWTHNLGYLHGAILPPHVLYFPDNQPGPISGDKRRHAVRLVDWCYAIPFSKNAKFAAWCPEFEACYPPEVFAKKQLGPWTDIYMGAKTMLYLLGGDVTTNKFPPHVPKEISNSILQCLHLDPKLRPKNTKKYFDSFVQVLQQLYGKPKYHQFVMPGI